MTVGKDLIEISNELDSGVSSRIYESTSNQTSRQKLLSKDAERRKKRAQQFGMVVSTGAQPDAMNFSRNRPSSSYQEETEDFDCYKDEEPDESQGNEQQLDNHSIKEIDAEQIPPRVSVSEDEEENDREISNSVAPTANMVIETLGIQSTFDPSNEAIVDGRSNSNEPAVTSEESIQSSFLINAPAPKGKRIQCTIIRRRGGIDSFYPRYELFLENQESNSMEFILAARKRKKSKNSNYCISTSKTDSNKLKDGFSGKVRSNFLGTAFNIYDNGYNPRKGSSTYSSSPRQEIATVLYDPNILGIKGPRKMTVLLPSMTPNGELTAVPDMLEKYKKGYIEDMLVLNNKSPQWNEETQSYVLNFNGRVSLASVKNFQIVHSNDLDYIIMQFGRTGKDTFTMDFQYPLCAVQAFGIALTSFDGEILEREWDEREEKQVKIALNYDKGGIEFETEVTEPRLHNMPEKFSWNDLNISDQGEYMKRCDRLKEMRKAMTLRNNSRKSSSSPRKNEEKADAFGDMESQEANWKSKRY